MDSSEVSHAPRMDGAAPSPNPSRLLNYGMVAEGCPDHCIPLLRELLAYDAQCEASCVFARNEFRRIWLPVSPSPLHWSRQIEWPWCIQEADLTGKELVLDVGAGWSVLKFALARRSAHVWCVDPDKESRRKGQETIDRLWMRNITMEEGDARKLPYPCEAFDRVVCISVVEHIPDSHLDAVKEMVRVLKPGGVLLLSMDIVIEGNCDGTNFYVDQARAREIMEYLRVPFIPSSSPTTIGARMEEEGVGIAVMLIRYVKPWEEASNTFRQFHVVPEEKEKEKGKGTP